jgi:hypothetical protein
VTMTSTPRHWKLVVDAHDPHAQADFWAAALGYEVEDHSALIGKLGARIQSHVREPGGEWVVMTDPEGNEFCVH